MEEFSVGQLLFNKHNSRLRLVITAVDDYGYYCISKTFKLISRLQKQELLAEWRVLKQFDSWQEATLNFDLALQKEKEEKKHWWSWFK